MKPQVICLPGGLAPAAQRFGPLIATLGGAAELHVKDLEIYRGAVPPSDYSIDIELLAIDRFAESLGLEQFHLVGYSGGGFISLVYAGTRPQRLLSLGLFEPAMVPGDKTSRERAHLDSLRDTLRGLEGADFLSAFMQNQVKPGVQLPPPSEPIPPAMQNRPAGLTAMLHAFLTFEFDRNRLRAGGFPVFLGYGDLTHEVEAVKAGVLAELLSDVRIKRYPDIHHFVPPEQIYTLEHATALQELWHRAEDGARQPA